ncbi:MAG: glycosyltransferase family 61 protein [Syntrophales bacterium]|jgi:hypothetical protein
MSAIKLPIIDSSNLGKIVKTIKEETIEKVFFPKVFGLALGGQIDFRSPKLDLIKYKNATVFQSSDFILVQDGAVWEKFHKPQFTKIVPLDKDLLKVENNLIYIKKPSQSVNVKIGYSLCGVHSKVWSHFLVQYLPKLYLIRDLRNTIDQNMTIILPKYTDPQIREIVYTYLNNSEGLEIMELQDNEVAICDSLFHIGNTAYISDHASYISPADFIIPKFVAQSLKNNLLSDSSLIYNDVADLKDKKLKLYIGRNGYRNVLNSTEIEAFFKAKGFDFVFPHTLTLKEKIKLFRRAEIVVGPGSSGFTNLLFSKPNTKVLVFFNFSRCFEPYLGFLSEYFGIDFTVITGFDDPSAGIHNSYRIPLAKIMSACDHLGI